MALHEGNAMTNKEKKEILNRYHALDRQLKIMLEAYEYMCESIALKSPQYDGMPHGTDKKDIADILIKKEQLEADYWATIEKKQEAMRMIETEIEKLTDENEKLVLKSRYTAPRRRRWEEIAVDMQLPLRRVYYLHGTALSHFMEGADDG